jgi:hypothetical protein
VDLTVAALWSMVLSFVVFGTLAGWYLVPRARRAPDLSAAIVPLVWVHALRHIALQLFSHQAAGFPISDAARNEIVYGDLAGMILALATLYALRYRWRGAVALAWVLVAATVVDLGNAAVRGLREQLFAEAEGWSWFILTFYVPALWVTVVLVAWQLWVRRRAAGAHARPRSDEGPPLRDR